MCFLLVLNRSRGLENKTQSSFHGPINDKLRNQKSTTETTVQTTIYYLPVQQAKTVTEMYLK